MDIRLEVIGTTLVAKLSGELDHHTAPKLRDTLDREINSQNIVNLVHKMVFVIVVKKVLF